MTSLTVEFTDLEFEALMSAYDAAQTARRLRRERPWARDIIRVLWGQRLMRMDDLTTALWDLREPSGLPMPKAFKKTVQSMLNQHTSQSTSFGSSIENDPLLATRQGLRDLGSESRKGR
jgi:hypothetical protein